MLIVGAGCKIDNIILCNAAIPLSIILLEKSCLSFPLSSSKISGTKFDFLGTNKWVDLKFQNLPPFIYAVLIFLCCLLFVGFHIFIALQSQIDYSSSIIFFSWLLLTEVHCPQICFPTEIFSSKNSTMLLLFFYYWLLFFVFYELLPSP